jgi:hypothetical protein
LQPATARRLPNTHCGRSWSGTLSASNSGGVALRSRYVGGNTGGVTATDGECVRVSLALTALEFALAYPPRHPARRRASGPRPLRVATVRGGK